MGFGGMVPCVSFVSITGRKMTFDFHRIVKHAPDTDEIRLGDAIKQEMPRMPDYADFKPRPVTAISEMVTSDIFAKLEPADASSPLRFCSHIPQCRRQKAFVAQTRFRAETLLRPCKNLDNVGLRQIGKTNIGHRRSGTCPMHPCLGLAPELPNEIL